MEEVLKMEKAKLNSAVDIFVEEMKARLMQKVDEGYNGWDGKNNIQKITNDLYFDVYSVHVVKFEVVDKKTFIDIANRAMMLYHLKL